MSENRSSRNHGPLRNVQRSMKRGLWDRAGGEQPSFRSITSWNDRIIAVCGLLLVAWLTPSTLAWAELSTGVPRGGGEDETKVREKQAVMERRGVWRFDDDPPGQAPRGFSVHTVGGGAPGGWLVEAAPDAPSKPNILRQSTACVGEGCFHILLADAVTYDYVELVFRLHAGDGKAGGIGGAVFGLKDTKNFYGVMVDFSKDLLSVIRVLDGTVTLLGSAPVHRKNLPWHHVRVQRNTILSKEFIETFFDNQLAVSVEDNALGAGHIGLMTTGDVPLAFDSVDAIRMYSQRPLSAPPAY